MRAEPLPDALGVEIVHALRQHPDGLAVGQLRDADRALGRRAATGDDAGAAYPAGASRPSLVWLPYFVARAILTRSSAPCGGG